MTRTEIKVAAVVVTYRPDLAMLRRILDRLQPQCDVVIADNTPDWHAAQTVAACMPARRNSYAWMGGNIGIGAAQNHAIARAWAMGADAVLLLDDDSLPPPDLVEQLIACTVMTGADAVVGANALDDTGREISNARRVPGALPRCRDMMSSGTLIRRAIFERVGPFDESLFVDGVDFEWGWRAIRSGITLYLCRATAITHRLGEGRVAGLGLPSPIRHYFQYRNILRLMSYSHTPWQWRLEQLTKLPIKLGVIALLMPQRGLRLRHVGAGVRDALLRRHGPAPGSPPVMPAKPS